MKCNFKVGGIIPTTVMRNKLISKCVPSSTTISRRCLLSALLCLSVIITHLAVNFGVAAQNALPIQQISSSNREIRDGDNSPPSLMRRHGGHLYAPQHGYDNNIEFIHDQTENIFEVPSQLENNLNDQHSHNHNPHNPGDYDEEPPPNSVDGGHEVGGGDTYLHNGAPELDSDSGLHHRHHLDESLNENQLPDDDDDGLGDHGKFTELDGGTIVGETILRQSESPYVLNTDLEVEKGGRLIIEPGVTVEFAPMVGITVRGVIIAEGNSMRRITFKSQLNSMYSDGEIFDPEKVGARLVEGPSPIQGRLQLFAHGRWRSVCSNSRNWTIADYETVCRQMGFKGGRFWNWVERLQDLQPRLLLEEPKCRGTENTIIDCDWHSRQIGSGVCDYHNDIGVQCLPLLEGTTSHWRGIRFENVDTTRVLSTSNRVYEAESLSKLAYVDLIRAGSGRHRSVSSAIDVIGSPPRLSHVTVDFSAYTGINVTRPLAAFRFNDITVRRSRGYGIFVNSSYGSAHLLRTTVLESGSDGIKYVGHDLRSDERTDKGNVHDFCTFPTASGQTYPIALYATQTPFHPTRRVCGKDFYTNSDYILTMHFVHFVTQQNDTGMIEVFDGNSPNDRLLGAFSIRNFTRPQTVMTTKNKMYIRFTAEPRQDIVGYFRLTTGPTKTYDLNVTESYIADNNGRGISVDNLRSSVHVHNSSVSNNGHIAGIHVLSGAGDVNITSSQITFNQGAGVNITYYGGNRNISRTSIVSNEGHGIAVWLNQTTIDRAEFLAFNQTTVVEYSNVFHNLETGVLHGNFCGDSWVNITGNHFNDSRSHGIDIQSCWFDKQEGRHTRLQIGQNHFAYTKGVGILINPALHLRGKIEYNTFRKGVYGAVLVRNRPLVEFRPLPVRLLIQHNEFNGNQGLYVASLGVSLYSERTVQSILFTRNFVRNNKIREVFGTIQEEGFEGESGEGRLNPRSRVAAPVVVSSSNVDIYRNIFSNPDSRYEIGSQLSDQSEVINATYNFLGNTDEQKIFEKLFHRYNRYDLAKIEYFPYLLHTSNPGTHKVSAQSQFVPIFNHEGSHRVGGEIDGQIVLHSGSYTVEKDINIRPGGLLHIDPGVTLNFVPNVGIMVAGRLEARGQRPDDIMFTLKRAPVETADNATELSEMLDMEHDTEPAIILNEELHPKVPIRLLGGENDHEGRLQVHLDGKWGTVCDYNWNIINAALVCHQLGLALNPNDWQLLHSEVPLAGTSEDVIMSNVQCTEHDTDITKCRSEKLHKGEFYNSCLHANDVGIRCYEGAWAGMRFGVLADRSDLQYVTIEKAGIFDYSTNTFKAALQMDFARHNLESVRIVNNLEDGLGVIYSDIYGGSVINNVKNSEFSGNRGNGISLKQLGLQVTNSVIEKNRGSGINHDYVLSAVEQRELASWFHVPNDLPDYNEEESNYRPIVLPRNDEHLHLDVHQIKHIITNAHVGEPIERRFVVTCQPGYVIGVQLLNPIENRSTEDIWFVDSQTDNPLSDVWQLKRDLTVFPATSSSYGIILNYKSGSNAIGGVVMTVSTVPAPVQNIRNRVVKGPVPTLLVRNTKIRNNHRGLTATYYNRYLGNLGEHYLRKANESIRLVNCDISNNEREAFFIHAPFWDAHESNISEITIHVNGSLLMNNGRGIRQFSKDLRSSNNLFHYVLQDTTVEQNSQGGMELSLPHVWQYNENFTHSVFIGNTTWVRNRNFGVLIAGHFAEVNMTGSAFYENHCLQGAFGFRGMEKKMQIDNNKFMNNIGRFMVEFKADSLSEILGEVHAVFEYNDIRNNRYEKLGSSRGFSMAYVRGQLQKMSDPTCVIGFGGIQKVRVQRNLFVNNVVDYDLVAGVVSATLANILDARENWWGSIDTAYIDKRIFDFDDWNNHAEVTFKPYLLEDNTLGSISIAEQDLYPFDIENMGGRLYDNVTLLPRTMPYKITSDITVMPGATMRIRPGVEMEFAPNVGMLVLGTLEATGTMNNQIVMRPIEKTNTMRSDRMERDLESMTMHDSIRLCVNRNCTIDDSRDEPFHEGFLEYFNHTTVQWVPICDSRFTERNAQVVCRELGFDPLKVFYGHDRRLEYHTNSLTRIWSWVQPLECDGDEMRMEDCPERLNGQLYGRRHECKWDSVFVFVSCQGVPNEKNYWGGIRFANPDFEQNIYQDRLSRARKERRDSSLSFVVLEQAGILHGEKSPSVQTVFKNPLISSITIRDSAHHGVNLISPTEGILLNLLRVDNVLGQGINAISLTGEGRDSEESSFAPLRGLDLPYNIFSMIDMCDPKKVITIEERVLVYYKYDNNPVNCVKIFNSAYRAKPLGFRLLQSHLFNHSLEYGRPDGIHIFDGDIYNFTSRIKTRKIDVIHANSPREKNLFKTTMPSLSLRLVASGAPAHHGFIAEIVTLPISAIGFNRDAQHNVSNSEITRAFKGAFSYQSAGEVSPILSLDHNRFMENGQQFYGNFSTCEAAIHLDVQNMHSMFFRNNLVQKNQGGLWIRADSRGSATSMRGYIHHNLFTDNRNRPALAVDGRQSSPYQEVTVFNNYITQNKAAYEHVIRLKQVVSNFTYNYVHSNMGGQIMDISGFDKVRLPIYQSTTHNGFYSNIATDWRGRATIVAGTAGQHYVDNVFWNPDNDYEIITVNQSIYEYNVLYWTSSLELGKTKIDARQNFWHFNDSLAVRGRIRDFNDDPTLIEVDYRPFHMNNKTVLDGKCPPGWTQVIDTCYIYIGAPMTFREARNFCRSDNATLPFIRLGDRHLLWNYLIRQFVHFRGIDSVWVQDINFIEQCTSFIYDDIRIDDCDYKRPFLCEIDPQVQINPLSWSADIGTIAMIVALLLTFVLLFLCCCCWWRKSKVRHAQRLQRRNSIRQSIRSLNSIGADGTLRRRNMNMSRSNDILSSSGTDYKKMESNGSFDSMEKATVESDTTSFENYDTYNSRKQPTSPTTTTATVVTHNDPMGAKFGAGMKPHNSSYGKGHLAQIKTPKIYSRPAAPTAAEYQNGVELSFRNEGFRDNSTVYSGTTRQNSLSTVVTEGTPIMNESEQDDGQGSDYYGGDTSTMPMTNRRDNLSFLSELKNKLPEYETLPRPPPSQSSFMPSPESVPRPLISDEQHRSSMDSAGYHRPQIRKPIVITYTPDEQLVASKRPDSYYTAMKTARDSTMPSHNSKVLKPAPALPSQPPQRPRTVYESSGEQPLTTPAQPSSPPSRSQQYSRSKSEAILETNFDDEPIGAPLSEDNRSHSQPLETAM